MPVITSAAKPAPRTLSVAPKGAQAGSTETDGAASDRGAVAEGAAGSQGVSTPTRAERVSRTGSLKSGRNRPRKKGSTLLQRRKGSARSISVACQPTR